MTTLAALIERLESAPAGSRELDWAIREHLGLVEIPIDVVFGRNDGCWGRRVGEQIIDIGSVMDSGATSSDVYLPRYTTSIDAALTLVPEGWTRKILTEPGYDNGRLLANAKAELHHSISSGGGPKATGYGPTLALALCIAALKARGARP